MTPKEKAEHIYSRFYCKLLEQYGDLPLPPNVESLVADDAKNCSILALDIILDGENLIRTPLSFWQSVKTEIEKL